MKVPIKFITNIFFLFFLSSIFISSPVNALEINPEKREKPTQVEILKSAYNTLSNNKWHIPVLDASFLNNQGQGVTIAVLDTGVTKTQYLNCHNFVNEYDAFWDISGPGSATDISYHGTLVTQTIADCSSGIARNINIMPVRVFTDYFSVYGQPLYTDDLAVAMGIVWAVDNGADIINLSLGSDCYTTWESGCRGGTGTIAGVNVTGIVDSAIKYAYDNNVLVIAASGNSALAWVSHPANNPLVWAIGSINENLGKADFSNFGTALDFVAPGTNIDVDFTEVDGTSFSAPSVAAAAAVLKSSYPGLSIKEINDTFICTVVDLGDKGWDPQYGWGLIQINASLELLASGLLQTPWWEEDYISIVPISTGKVKVIFSEAKDCNNIESYTVNLNEETKVVKSGSNQVEFNISNSGNYSVSVVAKNSFGNVTSKKISTSMFIDLEPPIFENEIVNIDTNNGISIDWIEARDNINIEKYELQIFNQDENQIISRFTSETNYLLSTNGFSGGFYKVLIFAYDGFNNISSPIQGNFEITISQVEAGEEVVESNKSSIKDGSSDVVSDTTTTTTMPVTSNTTQPISPSTTIRQNRDTEPPRLTSFEVDKTIVDVTNNSATINISASAEDDFMGFNNEVSTVSLKDSQNKQVGKFKYFKFCETSCSFTIPKGSPKGTYKFVAELKDNSQSPYGTSNHISVVAKTITVENFNDIVSTDKEYDTTPPSLTSLQISSSVIDTTLSSSFIDVKVSATDPSGVSIQNSYVWIIDSNGIPKDVIKVEKCINWCRFNIPQSYSVGTYSFQIYLSDKSEEVNSIYLYPNTTFEIYQNFASTTTTTTTTIPEIDYDGPTLDVFTINKTLIDLSSGSSSIKVTVITSDPSGVDTKNGYVYLINPQGVQKNAKRLDKCISGCYMNIPTDYETGIYTFYIRVTDKRTPVRNSSNIIPNASFEVVDSLTSASTTTSTTIPTDLNPPNLDSFSTSANTFEVSSSSKNITVTIGASDISGIANVSDIRLIRSSDNVQIGSFQQFKNCDSSDFVNNDQLDSPITSGTTVCTFTIPQNAEPGSYYFIIELKDMAKGPHVNTKNYNAGNITVTNSNTTTTTTVPPTTTTTTTTTVPPTTTTTVPPTTTTTTTTTTTVPPTISANTSSELVGCLTGDDAGKSKVRLWVINTSGIDAYFDVQYSTNNGSSWTTLGDGEEITNGAAYMFITSQYLNGTNVIWQWRGATSNPSSGSFTSGPSITISGC